MEVTPLQAESIQCSRYLRRIHPPVSFFPPQIFLNFILTTRGKKREGKMQGVGGLQLVDNVDK